MPARVLTFLSRLSVKKFPTGFAKMSRDSTACIIIKDLYLILNSSQKIRFSFKKNKTSHKYERDKMNI